MFVNFIRENLTAIGILKDKPALPEESVMLNLRARGLRVQTRKKLFRTLLVGFCVGHLLSIITLPIAIFKRLPSFILKIFELLKIIEKKYL